MDIHIALCHALSDRSVRKSSLKYFCIKVYFTDLQLKNQNLLLLGVFHILRKHHEGGGGVKNFPKYAYL